MGWYLSHDKRLLCNFSNLQCAISCKHKLSRISTNENEAFRIMARIIRISRTVPGTRFQFKECPEGVRGHSDTRNRSHESPSLIIIPPDEAKTNKRWKKNEKKIGKKWKTGDRTNKRRTKEAPGARPLLHFNSLLSLSKISDPSVAFKL